MINVNGNTYDGIIIKPDIDEALAHYGVKGMKWKNKKARLKTGSKLLLTKMRRKIKGMKPDQISYNNGKYSNERHDDGKAKSTSRPYGNRVYKGKAELYNNGYSDESIRKNYTDKKGNSIRISSPGAASDANAQHAKKYKKKKK